MKQQELLKVQASDPAQEALSHQASRIRQQFGRLSVFFKSLETKKTAGGKVGESQGPVERAGAKN